VPQSVKGQRGCGVLNLAGGAHGTLAAWADEAGLPEGINGELFILCDGRKTKGNLLHGSAIWIASQCRSSVHDQIPNSTRLRTGQQVIQALVSGIHQPLRRRVTALSVDGAGDGMTVNGLPPQISVLPYSGHREHGTWWCGF
jgi:hypothetical protein